MYDNSEMAYEKVTTFKEKVFCKSLSIFSYIMKALYQEDKNTFLTFQTADEHLKNDIAERIHFEVEKVIDEFNTIKTPYASLIPVAMSGMFMFDKNVLQKVIDMPKEENQNTLDSLLKPCVPLMWNYINVFQEKTSLKELH